MDEVFGDEWSIWCSVWVVLMIDGSVDVLRRC